MWRNIECLNLVSHLFSLPLYISKYFNFTIALYLSLSPSLFNYFPISFFYISLLLCLSISLFPLHLSLSLLLFSLSLSCIFRCLSLLSFHISLSVFWQYFSDVSKFCLRGAKLWSDFYLQLLTFIGKMSFRSLSDTLYKRCQWKKRKAVCYCSKKLGRLANKRARLLEWMSKFQQLWK